MTDEYKVHSNGMFSPVLTHMMNKRTRPQTTPSSGESHEDSLKSGEQARALVLADELELHIGEFETAVRVAEELRRLHAENEKLLAALRWHIRVYRVADEAWNPDAEVERLMALEMKGEK